ncbi:MAG: ABC transporter permease subunit [Candidatus Latescibacteria bacterium]|jgi:ABC-type transport system involved in multi-copper enzyme maturation permease subunit|nr:ABC transporter permease subunit [Candidatus Latescibacterota bacterium]
MFATLILKEIQETIHSLKFHIATLLCIMLIPLGFFVTLKDYEQRLADYNDSVRLYEKRSETRLHYTDFRGEGYRPPSALSVFAVGLEYFLPNKVVTSRDGQYQIIDESGINNPQSMLFGKIDFLFNVNFVLTLLALIFTFNSISGEKESGALKLIMSQSLHRWRLLLAKVLGNFLVFLAPFTIAIVLGLIVVNLSGVHTFFSSELLPTFLVIIFVTLLFIFSIFNLGMLVSTLTHQSMTSMISLLFIWTVFVLVVPKISPMIAQILYPVKSQQVFNIEKQVARADIENELDQKRRELFEKVMMRYGVDFTNIRATGQTEKGKTAYAQYDEEKILLEEEYNKKISTAVSRIEQDYANARNNQALIAMNISRVSPVSCYTYIVSELSGTGLMEMNNFNEHARRFQDRLKEMIYDNYIIKSYGNTRGSTSSHTTGVEGFDPSKLSVPHLKPYNHVSLREALKTEWIDVLLLALFTILFFAASFVSFLKYDVR